MWIYVVIRVDEEKNVVLKKAFTTIDAAKKYIDDQLAIDPSTDCDIVEVELIT